MNRYARKVVNEHLGFLLMGGWTVALALAQPGWRWLTPVGHAQPGGQHAVDGLDLGPGLGLPAAAATVT